MSSTSEEDDMSSDEQHPEAFGEPSPVPIHVHASESLPEKSSRPKAGGRIPVAASAGAAAAVLGAGFALAQLLRRRMSRRGSISQPKGELSFTLSTLAHAR